MTAKKNVTRATETLVYNIRGWMTSLQSPYFSQTLHYSDGTGTPCYNGNISSMTWKAGSETTLRGYKFTYNGLSRLDENDGYLTVTDAKTHYFIQAP